MSCGMTAINILSVSRNPAWLAIALAAAAMPPTAAQAADHTVASKTLNAKHLAVAGDPCPVNAGRAAATIAAMASATSPRPVAVPVASALDRMRMRQQAPASMIAAVTPGSDRRPLRAIASGAGRFFDPARRTPAPLAIAAAPTPAIDCARPADAVLAADVEFGTQAIPVATTRFDARWARVRRAPAAALMQVQLARAGVTRGLGEAAMIERINQWVNRHIAYVSDDRNYGQSDVWATAGETIARSSGDCEDFAILKMHMLRAAGLADDRMKLVLVRDLAINADHAVLLVRSGAALAVLDNMTDRVYDGRQVNSMRPILSFSGSHRWIHGYRDAAAPLVVAAGAVSPKNRPTMIVKPTSSDRLGPLFKIAAIPAVAGAARLSFVNDLPGTTGHPSSGNTRQADDRNGWRRTDEGVTAGPAIGFRRE